MTMTTPAVGCELEKPIHNNTNNNCHYYYFLINVTAVVVVAGLSSVTVHLHK